MTAAKPRKRPRKKAPLLVYPSDKGMVNKQKLNEKVITDIKLTVKQNAVIYCLQNGWILITSSEMRGAIVCTKKFEYRIGSTIFWNLYDKGLIHQMLRHPHDYVLTEAGKKIKTRKVTIS